MYSKKGRSMRARCFFAMFVLTVGLCLCVLVYMAPRIISRPAPRMITRPTLAPFVFSESERDSHKTILYWNTFFGNENFWLGEGYVARHCPRYKNCIATHSRHLWAVESFDAVVIHGISGELNDTDMPERRRPEQRYVFVSRESPVNRNISYKFDGYFNLTMTHQLDSDIIWNYADMLSRANDTVLLVPSKDKDFRWNADFHRAERDEAEDAQLTKMIKAKRKLAVWYRSNCKTRGGREGYIDELEKYMPVAKYGKCSDEPGCPRNQDCFKTDVEPNYFFYLSFENSLCKDYVTEKLFNALRYNVVPVVYGGANYSQFAPPNSYINALDFNTPEDLAQYLINLSRNTTEYKRYFDWKTEYRFARPEKRVICDLCEILNGDQKKTYAISKWYSSDNCPLQRQLNEQMAQGGLDFASRKTLLIP